MTGCGRIVIQRIKTGEFARVTSLGLVFTHDLSQATFFDDHDEYAKFLMVDPSLRRRFVMMELVPMEAHYNADYV